MPRSSTGKPLLHVCPGGRRSRLWDSARTALSALNRSSIFVLAAIVFSLNTECQAFTFVKFFPAIQRAADSMSRQTIVGFAL